MHYSLELLTLFEQIKQPQVRDLAWVIGSESLVHLAQLQQQETTSLERHPFQAIFDQKLVVELELLSLSPIKALNQARDHLLALESSPNHLIQALEGYAQQHKRVRLGVYYEHLVYYWLEHILGVQDLNREIQLYANEISKGKRTLGALDLVASLDYDIASLLFDSTHLFEEDKSTTLGHSKLTIHFELASKFYLKVSPAEMHTAYSQLVAKELYAYVGPNERDSFGGKLDHLLSHQLPLSERDEAKSKLQELKLEVAARCLWLKGRLFEHIHHLQDLKFQHLWLRQHELDLLFTLFNQGQSSLRALLCEKPAWFAPPHLSRLEEAEPINRDQLILMAQEARGERGSTLFYVSRSDFSQFAWLMIVPDLWGRR